MAKYEIHPKLGVARLGNSPDEFYLAPDKIGGLPIMCDRWGNAKTEEQGTPVTTDQFKDSIGRVKRQAAKFKIFENIEGEKVEINVSREDVVKIDWTVHLANKKPIWYTFSELLGDLEFGEENSYKNQHVPLNNAKVKDHDKRQKLIIDPGPRSISSEQRGEIVEMSRYNKPDDYKHFSFPPVSAGGSQIDKLGDIRVDDDGNLVAMGGLGNVTGSAQIDSFRGAGGYWDDIADGYVVATLHIKVGASIETFEAAPAWLLVGSPKYAPELVNITNLHDTMFNTALRHLDANKAIYEKGLYGMEKFLDVINNARNEEGLEPLDYVPLQGYNVDYTVSYTDDIKPIIDRIKGYKWVADIPYLSTFANPDFDMGDNSEENARNRWRYFNYFRVPLPPEDYTDRMNTRKKYLKDGGAQVDNKPLIKNGPSQLFAENGVPLMPLNSGDNSVTNQGPIYKFETLSATQYFYMYQWAIGNFDRGSIREKSEVDRLDEAGPGNCVGAPFSPGIETTWIMRNAPIYHKPFVIKLAHFQGNQKLAQWYEEHGLSTTEDEAEGFGCEPGDLTKRMAIPWQSDFAECTIQTPNITNPHINQWADGTQIEVPPAYYVYWWPPQSPMHITTGSRDANDQVLDGLLYGPQVGAPIIAAGQRVPYQRGINKAEEMIASWSRLGFIVNQSKDENMPYFVEKERSFGAFGQLESLQVGVKIQASSPK